MLEFVEFLLFLFKHVARIIAESSITLDDHTNNNSILNGSHKDLD